MVPTDQPNRRRVQCHVVRPGMHGRRLQRLGLCGYAGSKELKQSFGGRRAKKGALAMLTACEHSRSATPPQVMVRVKIELLPVTQPDLLERGVAG